MAQGLDRGDGLARGPLLGLGDDATAIAVDRGVDATQGTGCQVRLATAAAIADDPDLVVIFSARHLPLRDQAAAGRFQPSQSTTAPPITRSRSRPFSHGNSSVNIVTHCRCEHGMRVMSVPQNERSGPNASKI